jgi:hypothetical protein
MQNGCPASNHERLRAGAQHVPHEQQGQTRISSVCRPRHEAGQRNLEPSTSLDLGSFPHQLRNTPSGINEFN